MEGLATGTSVGSWTALVGEGNDKLILARASTTGVTGGTCGEGTEGDAEEGTGGFREDEDVGTERGGRGGLAVVVVGIDRVGGGCRGGTDGDGEELVGKGRDNGAGADGGGGEHATTGGCGDACTGPEAARTAGATPAEEAGAGVGVDAGAETGATTTGAGCGPDSEGRAGRGMKGGMVVGVGDWGVSNPIGGITAQLVAGCGTGGTSWPRSGFWSPSSLLPFDPSPAPGTGDGSVPWSSPRGAGLTGGAGAGDTAVWSASAVSINERRNASLNSGELLSSIMVSCVAGPSPASAVRCLLFGVSCRSFHSGSTVRFLSSQRSLSGEGRPGTSPAGESVISQSSVVRSMMSSSPVTSICPSSGIDESSID